MKIPNKAYDAYFVDDTLTISYLPRKSSDSEIWIDLPAWLVKLIKEAKQEQYRAGKAAKLNEFKKALEDA